MTLRSLKPKLPERLQVSPNFVQAFTLDGRPYIAKETEPYSQYWLTERYRIIVALFSSRRGNTISEVIAGYYRLTRKEATLKENKLLLKAIEDMRTVGVLVNVNDDTSRYTAQIVADYILHRPFPSDVVNHIVHHSKINANSRVLDLAGGPGDLALMLAKTSDDVALMELSKGFLNAASERAKNQGVNLSTLHESCNRLVYQDDEYDLITLSQALHWLDDVMVCRGVCKLLRVNGNFFVIHSAIELDNSHPLAYLLGYDSILGKKLKKPFVDEVKPLFNRLALLFEALDSPEVQRVNSNQLRQESYRGSIAKIVPVGVGLFRQQRPFDAGYARGFLTPKHIEVTGKTPIDFWKELETKCAETTEEQMLGKHYWAVIQFRRDSNRPELEPLETCQLQDIGYKPGTVNNPM